MPVNVVTRATRAANGCLEWSGAVADNGYGKVWDGKKVVYAHRQAYVQNKGPISAGLCVMHSCDNRRCVDPDHLSLGSQKENLADMRRKGRDNRPRGERHSKARLTAHHVEVIKKLYNWGCLDGTQIAVLFGVGYSTIYAVLKNRSWKHIK